MDERRLELKVGAFALMALALAVGIIVALTGLSRGQRFIFHADFSYAGGLPTGAAVKIAGVKVGRVREVVFRPDAHDGSGKAIPVRLTAEIDRFAAAALRSDATATVGTQGALGESYLEVMPGRAATALAENAAVRGLDPPRLDLVLARLFSFLEDAVTEQALRNFLVNVAQLAEGVGKVLEGNREQITRFIGDAATLLESTRATVGNLQVASRAAATLLADPQVKEMVTDFAMTAKAARTQVPDLLSDSRALVGDLKKATGSLTAEDIAHVRQMIERFDALAGQLQKVSTRADGLLAEIDRGEGTLGKVIKDPKVYDDLRALLADIKAKPWKLVWKE